MTLKMADTPRMNANEFVARKVEANPKCTGCLHYETHKSACLVSLTPMTCGAGDEPFLGYAPLAQLKPGDPHVGPSIGAAQAVAGNAGTASNAGMETASPIEFLGDEAPQLAAMVLTAAQAHMAKSQHKCPTHAFGSASGIVNPTALIPSGDVCLCDQDFSDRTVKSFYANLSPRFRYGYSEEVVGILLNDAADALLEKAGRGAGSRGGRIAYYTKTGKPVYGSKVAKIAPEMDKMMTNWHHNATRSNNPEDHAIAAKQAHAAAFYHHHNEDPVAAHQAMDYAHHHMKKYQEAGHKSRTTKWIDQNHEDTKKLTGWHSDEDDAHVNPKTDLHWQHGKKQESGGLGKHSYSTANVSHDREYGISSTYHPHRGERHNVTHRTRSGVEQVGEFHSRKEAENAALAHHHKHQETKKSVRTFSDLFKAGAGSRGGHILGYTRSGKPVYAHSDKYQQAYNKFYGGRKKKEGESHQDVLNTMKEEQKKHEDKHKDFSEQDHEDAHHIHLRTFADDGNSSHVRQARLRVASDTHHGGVGEKPKYTKDFDKVYEESKKPATWDWKNTPETKKSLKDKKKLKKDLPPPGVGGQAGATPLPASQHAATRTSGQGMVAGERGGSMPARGPKPPKPDMAGPPIAQKGKKPGKAYKSFGELFKSKGEGSHGGHIIGHTKSGKPVYGPHKGYSGGHSAPHMDALHAVATDRKDIHEMGLDDRAKLREMGHVKRNANGTTYVTKQGKEAAEAHAAMKDYTAEDHEDAYHAHMKESLKRQGDSMMDSKKRNALRHEANAHIHAAHEHSKAYAGMKGGPEHHLKPKSAKEYFLGKK